MAGVRQLLLFAIALGLTSGTAHAQQKFSGQTLRVAEFGGSWQQWLLKNIAPRFEQETGAKVEYLPGIPVQFMAQMVSNKGQSPPFDLANLSDDLAPQRILKRSRLRRPIRSLHR